MTPNVSASRAALALSAAALAFASGGVGRAVALIDGHTIRPGTVGTAQLAPRAVNGAKLDLRHLGSVPSAARPFTPTYFVQTGLIRLREGQRRVVYAKAPYRITATCSRPAGAPPGVSIARLMLTNTGSRPMDVQSEQTYRDRAVLRVVHNETKDVSYQHVENSPGESYFFDGGYNDFSGGPVDGSAYLSGGGAMGVHVLGADCVFALHFGQ